MSSAAVFQALARDPQLNALGITADAIFPDYVAEVVPRNGMFLILRWGSQDYRSSVQTGPVDLTVWVHQPAEQGSDYGNINKVRNRVRAVLEGMEQATGSDGYRVTSIGYAGASGNLYDPGFKTITKNDRYMVLMRMVA